MDGLRFIAIVEVKKKSTIIKNKKGQSREKLRYENRGSYLDKQGLIFFKIGDYRI